MHENDMTQRLLTSIRSFDSLCTTAIDPARFVAILKEFAAFAGSLVTLSKYVCAFCRLSLCEGGDS